MNEEYYKNRCIELDKKLDRVIDSHTKLEDKIVGLQQENQLLKEKVLLLQASEPMLEFAKQTYKTYWETLKQALNEAKHEYRTRNNKDLQDYYEVCVQQINNILDKMHEIEVA